MSSPAISSKSRTTSNRPWNPYLAGGLTGLAVVISLVFYDQMFGAADAYVYVAKHLWYFTNLSTIHQQADPTGTSIYMKLTWQVYFVVGIALGAFFGAYLFGDFKWQGVPDLWRQRFGPSLTKRLLWAFIGGFIGMAGVMIAGGCPSGLGLSGMMLLSLGGFAGFATFFIGGIIMAHLLYGGGKRS